MGSAFPLALRFRLSYTREALPGPAVLFLPHTLLKRLLNPPSLLLTLTLLQGAWARSPGPSLEDDSEGGGQPDSDDLGADTGIVGEACPASTLIDGAQVPEQPELYLVWHADRAWGVPDLVDVLVNSAEEMAWLVPDGDPIVIGDLSHEHGGPLYGHRSHRGGLDADIGLYSEHAHQNAGGFLELSPEEFDAATNWLLIRSLLETGRVERILLDQGFIRKLREYLAETGEIPPEEIDRIFPGADAPDLWSRTGIVQHAPNHRHHMHVRVACPAQ